MLNSESQATIGVFSGDGDLVPRDCLGDGLGALDDDLSSGQAAPLSIGIRSRTPRPPTAASWYNTCSIFPPFSDPGVDAASPELGQRPVTDLHQGFPGDLRPIPFPIEFGFPSEIFPPLLWFGPDFISSPGRACNKMSRAFSSASALRRYQRVTDNLDVGGNRLHYFRETPAYGSNIVSRSSCRIRQSPPGSFNPANFFSRSHPRMVGGFTFRSLATSSTVKTFKQPNSSSVASNPCFVALGCTNYY